MTGGAPAEEILQNRIVADPNDAAARYQLAILLLDQHTNQDDPDPDLLRRATEHLDHAIAIRPSHAPSHAALGYACAHAETGLGRAIECFRTARRLDPADRISDVYVPTLLVAAERDAEALVEIEAAAPRHDVDLTALRASLTAVGFPTDPYTLLVNGFIRAGNFFRSKLIREAGRIRNRLERGRKQRAAADELAGCKAAQRDLAQSFDASQVPDSLRALAAAASRYGVGDDYCRPFLLKRLPKKQRTRLIAQVDAHADAIAAWLDRFAPGQMPDEAAAFMYLLSGVDEIRD